MSTLLPAAPPIILRHARPSDVPAIVRITARESDDACVPLTPAHVMRRLGGWIVACDAAGRIVGSVCLDRIGASRSELRSLVVVRRARGLGVGGQLVERVVRIATRAGLDLVCTTASPHFFARYGFVQRPDEGTPSRHGRTDPRRVVMGLLVLNPTGAFA
ncbi:MAG: GNAT family N-acetyltransferase [Planctomycetota bacterium]